MSKFKSKKEIEKISNEMGINQAKKFKVGQKVVDVQDPSLIAEVISIDIENKNQFGVLGTLTLKLSSGSILESVPAVNWKSL